MDGRNLHEIRSCAYYRDDFFHNCSAKLVFNHELSRFHPSWPDLGACGACGFPGVQRTSRGKKQNRKTPSCRVRGDSKIKKTAMVRMTNQASLKPDLLARRNNSAKMARRNDNPTNPVRTSVSTYWSWKLNPR